MIRFFNQLKIRLFNKENQVYNYCPLCEDPQTFFKPIPDFYIESWKKHQYKYFGSGEMIALKTYSCSTCGASDRERLYSYWILKQFGKKLFDYSKVIHFSPEAALENQIRSKFKFYETADLISDAVNHRVDLMKLPFKDNTYDFFICSHVLEHVIDDKIAVKELYRILKPGGRGILMVPISLALKNTIEDIENEDEYFRWQNFGQFDHLRLYAHDDYVELIKNAGFCLDQLDKTYFGNKIFKLMGLKDSSILYIVEKK
jgi:SAM-dependent methyltransferase